MDDRFRLNELAQLVGATPRTIRFYIAEGLLPPPTGAGPAAVYTAGHRDRLLLIERLKDRYLPLREIRRHIAPLTDDEVRAELRQLAREQVASSTPPGSEAVQPGPAAAVDYLDNVLGRRAPYAPAPSSPLPAVPPLAPRPLATPPVREEWERIILGDGVELHIRTDRRREWVVLDALIRQARKLLGYEM